MNLYFMDPYRTDARRTTRLVLALALARTTVTRLNIDSNGVWRSNIIVVLSIIDYCNEPTAKLLHTAPPPPQI